MKHSERFTLREPAFWLLIGLGTLYFYRPLFLQETFFFRDVYGYFIPIKRLLTDFWQAGELPLWDPYTHGGQAFLPNIANGVCYPFNLLYLLLPFLWTFNLIVVLHVVGGAAAAYACARMLGFRPASSFVSGLIYGFCGCMLSLINLTNFLLAMPYLPLLVLSWHRYLCGGARRWFLLTMLFGILSVLPGAPEVNILSMLTLLVWTLCYPYPSPSVFRRTALWMLLSGFILALLAFQLLPTLEIMQQSSRGQRLSLETSSSWAMEPQRLLEIILPHFSGYCDTLDPAQYWATPVLKGAAYLVNIYCGAVAVVLMVFGGLHHESRDILPRRIRRALLILWIISALLALGQVFPLFNPLMSVLPILKIFRYPSKFLLAGIFPTALLAGYALDMLLCEAADFPRISRRLLGICWGIGGMLVGVVLLLSASQQAMTWMERSYFQQPATNDILRAELPLSPLHACGVWLAFTMLLQYRRRRPSAWQAWTAAGLLALDLFAAGTRFNPTAPKALFDAPPVVDVARKKIGEGRLWTQEISTFEIAAPSNDILWRFRDNIETLKSYPSTFFRIPVIFHVDLTLMAPTHLVALDRWLQSLVWPQRMPLLAAAGVTLIVSPEELKLPNLRPLPSFPHHGRHPYYFYRFEAAARRVEFVTAWREAASDEDALGGMLAAEFDPRRHVVLHKETPSQGDSRPAANAPNACPPASIERRSGNTHRVELTVSTACDGYLVFSEPFYPGWRARIDGQPSPIRRANIAFSAVFVPAGQHRVERYYLPDALMVGLAMSAAAALILLALIWTGWLIKIR